MTKMMERPVGGSVSMGASSKSVFASTVPASCKQVFPEPSLEVVRSPASHPMHLSFFPDCWCEAPTVG